MSVTWLGNQMDPITYYRDGGTFSPPTTDLDLYVGGLSNGGEFLCFTASLSRTSPMVRGITTQSNNGSRVLEPPIEAGIIARWQGGSRYPKRTASEVRFEPGRTYWSSRCAASPFRFSTHQQGNKSIHMQQNPQEIFAGTTRPAEGVRHRNVRTCIKARLLNATHKYI